MSRRISLIVGLVLMAQGTPAAAQVLFTTNYYQAVDSRGRVVWVTTPVAAPGTVAAAASSTPTGAMAVALDSRGRPVYVPFTVNTVAANAASSGSMSDDVKALVQLLQAVRGLRCSNAPGAPVIAPEPPLDQGSGNGVANETPVDNIVGPLANAAAANAASQQSTQTVADLERQLNEARWKAYHMQRAAEYLRQAEALRERARLEANAAGKTID